MATARKWLGCIRPAEGVTIRFQPLEAGLQGAAWYCDGCDSELRSDLLRTMFQNHTVPSYLAGPHRFARVPASTSVPALDALF